MLSTVAPPSPAAVRRASRPPLRARCPQDCRQDAGATKCPLHTRGSARTLRWTTIGRAPRALRSRPAFQSAPRLSTQKAAKTARRSAARQTAPEGTPDSSPDSTATRGKNSPPAPLAARPQFDSALRPQRTVPENRKSKTVPHPTHHRPTAASNAHRLQIPNKAAVSNTSGCAATRIPRVRN